MPARQPDVLLPRNETVMNRRQALITLAAAPWFAGLHPGRTVSAAERWDRTDHVLTRIAFGSCNKQHLPSPVFARLAGDGADLFLFIGDTVYADRRGRQMVPDDLRQALATLRAQPEFQALEKAMPIEALWDDHDFGRNDGGRETYLRSLQQAFMDGWRVPADDPRRRRRGLYRAWRTGPAGRRLQIILLDTRSFRSPLTRRPKGAPGGKYRPDPDPAKTMLGPDQWAWLAERLSEPAELRLIVSSIQVLSEGHGWERWGNLPAERERLFRLLREKDARGVLLLSGDRHVGARYEADAGLGYPLRELTSSAINTSWRTAPPEPGPHIRGDLVRDDNYGRIAVDWQARRLRLSLQGAAGPALLQHDLSFTDLGLNA